MVETILKQVVTEPEKLEAGALILEYLTWLNGLVKAQYGHDFDTEAMLESDLGDPEKFFPPLGRMLLAIYHNRAVGVGCLKELESGVGEVQRMYVVPDSRSRGLGRAIAKQLIHEACAAGYHTLRLESMDFLHQAHNLYESIGFRRIQPYADNSMSHYQSAESLERYYQVSVYMEMDLTQSVAGFKRR